MPIDIDSFSEAMISQHIDGIQLSDWILSVDINIDGRLNPRVQHVIKQIYQITEEFKRIGIIHGDLHADNILIHNDKPVIIDFGYSEYIINVASEDDFDEDDFQVILRWIRLVYSNKYKYDWNEKGKPFNKFIFDTFQKSDFTK